MSDRLQEIQHRVRQTVYVRAEIIEDWAAHGGRETFLHLDGYLRREQLKSLVDLAFEFDMELVFTQDANGRNYLAYYPRS